MISADIAGKTPVSHYTSEKMARDLTGMVPFEKGDVVLGPCSGRNKVWLRCFRYSKLTQNDRLSERP